MSHKFKNISVKNHKFFNLDDIINIKNFDPNKINIDEKS